METIKGGFPLPINWHVRNCNSCEQLRRLKHPCLLLRRTTAASCSTSSQTSWTSKHLQSSAFPQVVPCHKALNSQPRNSGVVSRPSHRPTSSLYSLPERTPDPENPLGTNVGSWLLCTPSPKLKIFFFSINMLSETKQNSLLDVGGCLFFFCLPVSLVFFLSYP